mmetsp:Transcript_51301/g.100748  ORF Transcript_51301/g.100748 Transcript_51301/m.100748 type:complete len:140 (-) Transcript_51301:270-689(-)
MNYIRLFVLCSLADHSFRLACLMCEESWGAWWGSRHQDQYYFWKERVKGHRVKDGEGRKAEQNSIEVESSGKYCQKESGGVFNMQTVRESEWRKGSLCWSRFVVFPRCVRRRRLSVFCDGVKLYACLLVCVMLCPLLKV